MRWFRENKNYAAPRFIRAYKRAAIMTAAPKKSCSSKGSAATHGFDLNGAAARASASD
jgi:hypothetical protein